MLLRIAVISIIFSRCLCYGHPHDPTVVHGRVQFCLNDKHLEIITTDRAIISWKSFSIPPDELVRFLQSSPHASVLNRVTGDLTSVIQGSLLSNGRVFLINERGIIVGKNAIINTSEFIASTLDILNEKFLNGDLAFQGSSDAEIINLGTIHAHSGDAVLIARRIDNRGQITAEGGNVLIGCGYEVLYKPHSDRPLSIITAPSTAARLLENNETIAISPPSDVEIAAHSGRIFINAGQIQTDEAVSIQSDLMDQYGSMTAASIDIDTDRYVDTELSSIDASSIQILAKTNLYSSGKYTGGQIYLDGESIWLCGAHLDASGDHQGGAISIGTSIAQKLYVSAASVIRADARQSGSGGRIVFWSDQNTLFMGEASAKGVTQGGFVEVSSAGDLSFQGQADPGINGSLLFDPKNIIIDAAAGTYPCFEFIDPNQGSGAGFGTTIVPLVNGNVVVAKPGDSSAASAAGAVYLYDGRTGALISQIRGSTAHDQIGSGGVTALIGNGNYVIQSPLWDSGTNVDAGAATWGSGTIGASGLVSAANSLVGSTANDQVSSMGVAALANGHYVVASPNWDYETIADAGAATWGNGTAGICGTVSAANSLIGSAPNDQVSSNGINALANGHYVVASPNWDNGAIVDAGAATWGDGTAGIIGYVSSANSLVGSSHNDHVSSGGVTALAHGSYVVASPNWNRGAIAMAGAATWCDGLGRATGSVSAANSLVGSTANDQIGSMGIWELANGRFVVASPNWDNEGIADAGAATWCDGFESTTGPVSAANSLVGTTAGDQVSSSGVLALAHGNYVVKSPLWDNGEIANAGAATWCNGSAGPVSAANSLIGTTANDNVSSGGVFGLSNGHYVVASPNWDNGAIVNAGAATWCDGAAGTTGPVSFANSLVGSTTGDQVSSGGVTPLINGHYVVASPNWDNGAIANAGAATWCDGTADVVSAANSLVGSTPNDRVSSTGVTALANGHYVVCSANWDMPSGAADVGAATWGDGTIGTAGAVSAANSLIGTTASDMVSSGAVIALSNGSYVIASPHWDHGALINAGAVTWSNGSAGTVSAANSVIGNALSANLQSPVSDEINHTFFCNFRNEWGSGVIRVGLDDLSTIPYAAGSSQTMTIHPDALTSLLNQGAHVTLEASNDITINSPVAIDNSNGAGGILTLNAGRHVLINAPIATDASHLVIVANAPLSSGMIGSERDAGWAAITLANDMTIHSTSGNLTLGPIWLDGSTIVSTSGGNITLATVDGAFALTLSAGTGDITAGAIGAETRLAALTVASARDVSIQGISTTGAMSINASRHVTINNSINTSDVSIASSGGSILVHSIDASGDITLQPAAGSSDGMPDGILGIFGNLAANRSGTISLSPIGRRDVMKTATIYGDPAGSDLNISGDILILGPYEALTVFGNVAMNLDTAATVGDIIALDNLRITAPTIHLMRHGNGHLADSIGAAYVTDNLHLFSHAAAPILTGTPHPIGTGPDPTIEQWMALSRDEWKNALVFSGYMLNFDRLDSILSPESPINAITSNSGRSSDIIVYDLFGPLAKMNPMQRLPFGKNYDRIAWREGMITFYTNEPTLSRKRQTRHGWATGT
ncbi:MAG: filamentous hemagglutinin N-terminal protein [Parachlamydiales bacterium]|nr:filamentous hemagglutinin N-terminal protein [Parachlamydiales bacterium]